VIDAVHPAGDGRTIAAVESRAASTATIYSLAMPNPRTPVLALVPATLGLLVSCLCGCGPGRTTFASYPSAALAFDRAGSDPKAMEIADKVIAAAGGRDKWAAAKQIRWSETVTLGEGKPPVKLEQAWDRWNGRHYGRLHAEQGDVVAMHNIYDGGGTAFAEVGRNRQQLGKEEIERAMAAARERWAFDATTLLLPFLLEAPGAKLQLAGEFPVEGGQPLDALKVTFDPKDPTRTATYYAMVNRTTNQIERIEIVKAGDPDTKRLGYKAGTWVDVGGMKLATVFENIGFAGEVITFSNISVGEPDETLYVPVTQ
jgi:hypothetical protein